MKRFNQIIEEIEKNITNKQLKSEILKELLNCPLQGDYYVDGLMFGGHNNNHYVSVIVNPLSDKSDIISSIKYTISNTEENCPIKTVCFTRFLDNTSMIEETKQIAERQGKLEIETTQIFDENDIELSRKTTLKESVATLKVISVEEVTSTINREEDQVLKNTKATFYKEEINKENKQRSYYYEEEVFSQAQDPNQNQSLDELIYSKISQTKYNELLKKVKTKYLILK